ncbi:MAG: response regulator [Bacteroidales bacterium]|nr:response regulator [Bacteroidales bacterium]
MNNLKTLIVEDELVIAEDIKLILIELGYEVVGIARSYDQAIDILNQNNIDLALLDIQLDDDKDGIELANYIRENYSIAVVFLTSHADQATMKRAKEVKPDGYLLKPFDKKDLYTTIEIGYDNFLDRNFMESQVERMNPENEQDLSNLNSVLNDCIFIKKDYLLIKIQFNKIKYIKTEGNYIEIYCTDKKHLVRSTLKDFLQKLPRNQFLQVHKSYSVNLSQIDAINHTYVQIEQDTIPVGRMYMDEIKRALNIDL